VKWLEVELLKNLVNIKIRQSPVNINHSFDRGILGKEVHYTASRWLGQTINCEEKWIRIFKHISELTVHTATRLGDFIDM
jgi:hypothetical protein